MRSNFFKTLFHWLTWPLKKLYTLWSHKRVEEFALKPMILPAKVISVGNITFGGTGKTPMVMWLAQQVRRLKPELKVGVHLRGYLGKMEDSGGLVSDGKRILAGPIDAGDEAFMVAHKLLEYGIPIGVGKHKAEAGAALIERFGLDVLILDDAFQFTSLTRDLDIVLIDTTRPFGEAGFPREGVMREPLNALERADVIVLTRTGLVGGGVLRGIIDRIKPFLKPGTNIFLSRFLPKAIMAVKSGTTANMEVISHRRAVPVSAIGNPRGFELLLEKMGLRLLKPIRYPDHHQFTQRDIAYINRQVLDEGGHTIMTTEKDMVRLKRLMKDLEAPIYCVPIELELKGEEEFLKILNKVLCSDITVKQLQKEAGIPSEERIFAVKDDYERLARGAEPHKTTAAKVAEGSDAPSEEEWWGSKE
jgi:tetraacyldisaccharide 4'-kinase